MTTKERVVFVGILALPPAMLVISAVLWATGGDMKSWGPFLFAGLAFAIIIGLDFWRFSRAEQPYDWEIDGDRRMAWLDVEAIREDIRARGHDPDQIIEVVQTKGGVECDRWKVKRLDYWVEDAIKRHRAVEGWTRFYRMMNP